MIIVRGGLICCVFGDIFKKCGGQLVVCFLSADVFWH